MIFLNDIEKAINSMINEIGSTGKSAGRTTGETMKYTFKYFMEFKHVGKRELNKRILTLAFVAGVVAAIWCKAPDIAAFLVEKSKENELLQKKGFQLLIGSTRTYQLLSATLIPYIYLMSVGSRKMDEARQFKDKFELIGMVKQLDKYVLDELGNKKRLAITPEQIACYKPNINVTIRLFLTNGQPLSVWEGKRAELEAAFNEPIYQLTNNGSSLNVVKMVTVSSTYKEELDKKYLKEVEYDKVFERIGLVGKGAREINHFGKKESIKNYPQYLDTEIKQINGKDVEILKFRSTGTELANWQSVKFLMENVLNKLVVKIEQAKKDKQIYLVYTLDLKDDLEECYDWSDDFISAEDGVLVLGEGLLGKVTLDINNLPHILIGGVTGFGKSVLSNCLSWQLIKKGAVVIPMDFKGGIELDMFSEFHEVIHERKRAIDVLNKLVKEYEERLKLIKSRKLKNISQFNKKYPEEALSRIVLVGDEVAEMLSGAATKAEANQIAELDDRLSTIARLARAMGIHLQLGTQRPDSNVLQGQIKNNLPARICGRMIDIQPSLMILGTPDATRIPDIKGRFMFSSGADIEIFQSYFFKESDIKAGNYVKGQCLVYDLHTKAQMRQSSLGKRDKMPQKHRLIIDNLESEVDDEWLVKQIGTPETEDDEFVDDGEGIEEILYDPEEEVEDVNGDEFENDDTHSNSNPSAKRNSGESNNRKRVEVD